MSTHRDIKERDVCECSSKYGLVLVCGLLVTGLQFEKHKDLEKAFRKDNRNLILLPYQSVVLDSCHLPYTKASSCLGWKQQENMGDLH